MNEWSNIAVIAPAHDIDISTVAPLRERMDELIDAGVRRILINCAGVTFIDSTGLACLLTRARRLLALGGLLSLVNASPHVIRFLQIARLLDVLHVSPAKKPAVPVLRPDTPPLWSKAVSLGQGMDGLPYYRHMVSEMLLGLSLGDDARFDTALAVSEALGNAFDHADAQGCSMNVSAYSDRVVVEVYDRGAGFELSADEDVVPTEERGRGIKLMRMLVDSVEVSRRRDCTGTVVRLVELLR